MTAPVSAADLIVDLGRGPSHESSRRSGGPTPAFRGIGEFRLAATERFQVAGVPVDVVDTEGTIARALARCREPSPPAAPPLTIFSCNVDMAVKANRDPEFARTLARGSIVTADGMPIVWLGRALGAPIPERVAGSDLVPALCAACAREGRSVFFFGAAPGVAALAAERLAAASPGLRVAGVLSPPFGFDRDPDLLAAAVAEVRATSPDVVFVALGAPRQERLVAEQGAAFGAKVLLGIGGSLDMAAGLVRRAPPFVRRAGGEWLWRLALEPRRLWRRYLVDDPAFAGLAAADLWRRFREGPARSETATDAGA